MRDGNVFLIVFAVFGALFMLFVTAPIWIRRISMWFVFASNGALHPEACVIAQLIRRRPESWRIDSHYITHGDTKMKVWRANQASGLHVESPLGAWTPSWIEREIIWEATRWRCNDYLKIQMRPMLDRAMAGPMLPRE